MNRYVVIKDRQGGSFGMGRAYTATEWLEQMLEWRDSDGNWGEWTANAVSKNGKYLDTRKGCQIFWQHLINGGREQELINYIGEFWDLDFAKCFEYCGKTFAYGVELDSLKNEYPYLATVYQLDEDEMPHEVWNDYYRTAKDAETEAENTFIESVREEITKLRKETD